MLAPIAALSQAGGAYIFRPKGSSFPLPGCYGQRPRLSVVRGPIVSEVRMVWADWATAVVRIYSGQGPYAEARDRLPPLRLTPHLQFSDFSAACPACFLQEPLALHACLCLQKCSIVSHYRTPLSSAGRWRGRLAPCRLTTDWGSPSCCGFPRTWRRPESSGRTRTGGRWCFGRETRGVRDTARSSVGAAGMSL